MIDRRFQNNQNGRGTVHSPRLYTRWSTSLKQVTVLEAVLVLFSSLTAQRILVVPEGYSFLKYFNLEKSRIAMPNFYSYVIILELDGVKAIEHQTFLAGFLPGVGDYS